MRHLILMKFASLVLISTKKRFHFSAKKKEIEISPLPFSGSGIKVGLISAADTYASHSEDGSAVTAMPQHSPISRTHRTVKNITNPDIVGKCSDIVCTLDRKGRFVNINEDCHMTWGYTKSEIEGSFFTDFLVTEDTDMTIRSVCRIFVDSAHIRFQNHCNHRDGSRVKMLWSLSWSAEDNLIYGVGINISYVRSTTDALGESAERYSSLFEHNPEAVFSLDMEGRFTSANSKTIEKTGCPLDRLIGESFIPFIVPEYLPLVEEKFEQAKLGEKTSYDIAMINVHHKTSYINVVNMPIIINGMQTGIFCIIKDISESEEYKQALQKLNESLEMKIQERTVELEQAIKEMEAFSYSVSHDLRAPLRIINGYAKLLSNEYRTIFDSDGREFMTAIIDNTKYMGRLIDDLLNLSRLGREAITNTHLDMTALAHVVIHEMKMDDPTITANFKIHHLKSCMGDQLLIRQVWSNLLSNAVKYSKKKEHPDIEIGSYEKGNSTVYYIKDNGAGFDMKFAAKLFGVFIRLHDRSEFDGTGVGLALVQRIVSKHGGKVWANGKLNEGAVFYFSLPAAN